MDSIFKFEKVNLIQFCAILMIVFRLANGIPPHVKREQRPYHECVHFGSCQTEIFWENQKTLPWKVRIEDSSQTVQNVVCDGILITNKHILAAASCILRGQDPALLQANGQSSLQYNRVELPRSYDRVDVTPKFVDVSKLYVHKNYSNSSHDFDISILKLESVLKFHPEDIYPAILPLSRLDHGNQLHVAMTKGLSEHYFERKNVSIWSKDECAPNEEHLMCIETDGDCDDLMHPSTVSKEKISPIFHISNGNREILGLPIGCKKIGSSANRSAFVYLRVADFLPWIHKIISNGGSECVWQPTNLNAVEIPYGSY